MAGGMGVGVQLLGRPPAAALAAIAKGLEVAGADSFWAPDHWMYLAPLGVWDSSTFPSARLIRSPEENFDAWSFLTWLAGRTRKATIGTAVTEAIRRHPAEIAQAALSIHHLSHGRFVLGIGAGEKENIEPYGLSYKGQVSRLEEALYVIRLLWGSKDYVSYQGKFFELDRAVIGLGPYRGKFPPIWIAAHGPRTLRLTGRYGDGWLPQGPSNTEMVTKLQAEREEHGRADRPMMIGDITPFLYVGTPGWDVGDGVISGAPGDIAEQILADTAEGVNQIQVRFKARSCDEICDQMAAFGSEVAPILATI